MVNNSKNQQIFKKIKEVTDLKRSKIEKVQTSKGRKTKEVIKFNKGLKKQAAFLNRLKINSN